MTEKPYILNSICVDASCSGNPGFTEYRGIYLLTKEILFENKYEEATNNIGEFLAIYHGIYFIINNKIDVETIYSDSITAISWIRKKQCKTTYKENNNNKKVFDDIRKAEKWLNENNYQTQVLKWDTLKLGEIPADYKRK